MENSGFTAKGREKDTMQPEIIEVIVKGALAWDVTHGLHVLALN